MDENSYNSGLFALAFKLLSVPILDRFALAGGTALSLRYNHRVSVDIYLFTNQIIGFSRYGELEKELKAQFHSDFHSSELVNEDSGDSFVL